MRIEKREEVGKEREREDVETLPKYERRHHTCKQQHIGPRPYTFKKYGEFLPVKGYIQSAIPVTILLIDSKSLQVDCI
jgi:hypothetical protein